MGYSVAVTAPAVSDFVFSSSSSVIFGILFSRSYADHNSACSAAEMRGIPYIMMRRPHSVTGSSVVASASYWMTVRATPSKNVADYENRYVFIKNEAKQVKYNGGQLADRQDFLQVEPFHQRRQQYQGEDGEHGGSGKDALDS